MTNITIVRGGILRENSGAYIRVMGTKRGLEKIGFHVKVCQPEIKYDIPFLRRLYWTAEVLLKSFATKTDIYYGHSTIGGYIALICARIKRKRFFYDVHDINLSTFHGYGGFIKTICDFLEKTVMKNSDGVVVTSEPVKNAIVRWGVTEKKIIIAPNGVNISEFNAVKKTKQKDKLIGVFVGVLIDWQLLPLFRIINQLLEESKNLELWIVGEGDIGKYKKMVNEKNRYRVRFFGPLRHTEIINLLSKGDFGLAPFEKNATTEYAHPLKVVEYIASGLPVIVTDLKGSRAILGNKGFYMSDDNPESIISYVKVLQNKKFREKISKEMLALSKNYDWETIMKPVKRAMCMR